MHEGGGVNPLVNGAHGILSYSLYFKARPSWTKSRASNVL